MGPCTHTRITNMMMTMRATMMMTLVAMAMTAKMITAMVMMLHDDDHCDDTGEASNTEGQY
jgi:hypothetical protein